VDMRIISAVKWVELVSDRMSYTMRRALVDNEPSDSIEC
jgi:hypothetical protein